MMMATKKVFFAVAPLAGIPLITGTVLAADEKKPNLVKVSELPIYSEPFLRSQKIGEDEKPSALLSGISEVRKSVWQVMDNTKETTDKIQDKWAVAKAHTLDAIHYIQNDPGYLPRIGVITISGLGGIVAGYKGGVLRKSFFALTAMGAAAAVCYPDEAMDITKTSYDTAKKHALDLWQDTKKAQDEKKSPSAKLGSIEKPKDVAGDVGMSKPEDKDMYSTRG